MPDNRVPEYYMARAIRLAEKGLYTTHPNPRVGCVLVKEGEIIGEGAHLKAGEAHAEVNALKVAGERASNSTAFVTLEPCSHTGKTPPCANALIDAGVSHVVIAMCDPNPLVAGRGIQKLIDAGIKVDVGLLEADAEALNPGFIKRMKTGLPFVRIKLAGSLDGRTAMASGESVWITGEAARRDVQFLRARASCILTGSGTVLVDDPSMNVRLSAADLSLTSAPEQPLRVVLDSSLKTPRDAKLYTLAGRTIVYTKSSKNKVINDNVEIAYQTGAGLHIDLLSLLQDLGKREINEIHVEAGAKLCGALLSQGLVDEIVLYTAPHIMGNTGKPLFHLPEIQAMSERISLDLKDVRQVGQDIRITLTPHIS